MNSIQKLFQLAVQTFNRLLSLCWPAPAGTPKLAIDYDQLSTEGLRLSEAIAVRSAEFWLALGEPRLALSELENLGDLARQNVWVQEVRAYATNLSQPHSD